MGFLDYAKFGFCWWDLPLAIILVALVVVFIIHMKKLKAKKDELQDAVARKYSDKVDI